MSKLYAEIYKLKNILRKGWLLRNACGGGTNVRAESDAEHVFSMGILALEIMEKENLKLDKLKVLKMIFYHELGEIDSGDVTPFDNVSKEEKFQAEHKCIERISFECEMPEILTLWLEFEENKTDEAKFVRIVDKFDAVLQAKIYSNINEDDGKLFEEFYLFYNDRIKVFEKYLGE